MKNFIFLQSSDGNESELTNTNNTHSLKTLFYFLVWKENQSEN